MSKNEKSFTECIKSAHESMRPQDFQALSRNETIMVINRFSRENDVFCMVLDGFLVIFSGF